MVYPIIDILSHYVSVISLFIYYPIIYRVSTCFNHPTVAPNPPNPFSFPSRTVQGHGTQILQLWTWQALLGGGFAIGDRWNIFGKSIGNLWEIYGLSYYHGIIMEYNGLSWEVYGNLWIVMVFFDGLSWIFWWIISSSMAQSLENLWVISKWMFQMESK